MKVQIVYLSASDDIDSTRDLLGWVQTKRAVLVWPDRGRVLERDLDLILLKRYAQSRQLAVGLLTFDSAIRQRGTALGFPLFESLEQLPEDRWRRFRAFDKERENPRNSLGQPAANRMRLARIPDWVQTLDRKSTRVQLSALLLLLLVLAVALIPSAEIILSPPKQLESAVLELVLVGFEARSDQFFAQVEQIRIQGSAELQTTGEAKIPVSPSKGSVIFKNLSPTMISIPRNLGIRPVTMGSIRFLTTRSGELPAEIGAEIELPIEAVEFGEQGNLPSGTFFSTEATFGLTVAITNQNPFRGGSSESRRSVAEGDLARLEEKLILELLTKAERELAGTLGSERAVLEKSASVERVLELAFSHGEGEPVERIMLDLDLNIVAVVYRIDDLLSRIREAIAANLDPNRVLIPNSVIVTKLQYFDREPNVIRIEGSTESYLPFVRQRVLASIRGRMPRAAQDNLEVALLLEAPPALRLAPEWLPWMPWLNNRIDVLYAWEE